ncbi:MAG: aspartate racemase, partial [bacterium]|nr:aspartate racemase [bacterium]
QNFYKGRLSEKYDLNVQVPNGEDRRLVHDAIYQELCLGKVQTSARTEFLRIIDVFAQQGAEGVILGCTEIGMLVSPQDTNVRLFDTTAIHATKAVEYAI